MAGKLERFSRSPAKFRSQDIGARHQEQACNLCRSPESGPVKPGCSAALGPLARKAPPKAKPKDRSALALEPSLGLADDVVCMDE